MSDFSEQPEARPQFETMSFGGTTKQILSIALPNALFTLLTLGIYRFWGKTRMRRYLWSAIKPGNDPLEYTGNGLEKLLGFLIAVAFLAVYLGFFQILLSFAGLSLFSGGDTPQDTAMQILLTQVTFLAVVPLIFYAQYRARRYILSRTRWRGIRFGVDPAAWGYVWRAVGHWLLTILSLGLLLPRQTFYLEKYKIDRTWYGNAKFEQGGTWTMLYPAMKHIFIGLALIAGPIALALVSGVSWLGIFTFVGMIWVGAGVFYYWAHSFRLLTAHKTLGQGIRFSSTPKTGTLISKVLLGSFLASLVAGVVISVFGFMAAMVMGGKWSILSVLQPSSDAANTGELVGMIVFVIGYLATLMVYGAFLQAFVTQPILAHFVESSRIENIGELEEITQRSGDEMVEAEGFADALDVGGAF